MASGNPCTVLAARHVEQKKKKKKRSLPADAVCNNFPSKIDD